MKKYTVIEKKIGETPLVALEKWRAKYPELAGIPLSYAGRLDPMAEGALIILIGDECKRQAAYRGLDKEYETEILLGFKSDTGDVLGLASHTRAHPPVSEAHLRTLARKLVGDHALPFPAFSSKTVGGVPLFEHALRGTVARISIPVKRFRVYTCAFPAIQTIFAGDLRRRIFERINTIPPVVNTKTDSWRDFRRTDIRARWNDIFKHIPEDAEFTLLSLTCIVSSGAYMRSLAEDIGARLDTAALALSIRRTKIGTYTKLPFLPGIWTRRYA